MVRYSRKSFLRRNLVDISLKAKNVKNDRLYALQVSNLRRDDFKEIVPSNKWERVNINRHAYMIFANSKVQSGFTDQGELVGMLCFDDGRKLRLKYEDLNSKDHRKINKIMFQKFAPEGIKKRVQNNRDRVRFRTRNPSRSTKR